MKLTRTIPQIRDPEHDASVRGMSGWMHTRGRWTVALILVLASMQSCRPDFTQQEEAVQSLLNVVSRIEMSLNEVDAKAIRKYIKEVNRTCIAIHDEVRDTLDLGTARELMRFCILEQHLGNCLQRKERIDAELYHTRNQLYDLRSDLKAGRGNKDSVNVYIEQEFLFVESLQERSEQVIVELNSCFETYTELKPQIDRLLIHQKEEQQP